MRPIGGGVQVDMLDLDPENPRLPEELQGHPQHEILAYLEENDVLDELAKSFVANSYFESEPILVLPPGGDGRRLVVEGNRRVGAIMILLGLPPAREADLTFDLDPTPTPEQLEPLRVIPAVEVADRDEVSRYLGFRHISGLKTWDPEAKARYLWTQVEEAASRGSQDPFYEVGRRVGSNAYGVRNAYNAFNVLRFGRDRLGLNDEVQYVLRDKFGVWTRLLGTANVPEYIGLSRAGTHYEDVRDSVETLDRERLAEVLRDLKPPRGQRRAVLQDSRDATDYSDVLGDERAHATLRAYQSLDLAHQVVEQGPLLLRLSDLVDSIDVLIREVPRMAEVGEADLAKANELVSLSRSLAAVVESAAAGVGA